MVEVEIVDVRIEESTKQPFVELRPKDGSNRVLPIFIGVAEAGAIKAVLDGKSAQRPMTHDLFTSTLQALGARLDQVVITEFQRKIFFAELHLAIGEGSAARREVVSCRPSDGVALAVRSAAPVFVNDQVLDECAIADPGAAVDDGDLVDEFRRFIDDIDPDDFR